MYEPPKVNVLTPMVHGGVDSCVLPKQAKIYREALDDAGTYCRDVELEGANRYSNTLFYEHQIELCTEMIDFLKTDCGMQTGLQARASDDQQ